MGKLYSGDQILQMLKLKHIDLTTVKNPVGFLLNFLTILSIYVGNTLSNYIV